MKKVIGILAAVVTAMILALTVTGCKPSNDKKPSGSPTNTPPAEQVEATGAGGVALYERADAKDVAIALTLNDAAFTKVRIVGGGGAELPAQVSGGQVTIASSAVAELANGEYELEIVTSLNTLPATLKVCDKVIRSGAELSAIRQDETSRSSYYILGSDIELNGYSEADGQGWLSIGSETSPFCGTLDGNGHILRNLSMERVNDYSEDEYNAGLFSYIAASGTVKNLGLVGGTIYVKKFAGGIAATNAGTIENCFVDMRVQTQAGMVAGLVNRNSGTIENCMVYGSVVDEAGEPCAIQAAGTGKAENVMAKEGCASQLIAAEAQLTAKNVAFKSEAEMRQAATFAAFDKKVWSCADGFYPEFGMGRDLSAPASLTIGEKSQIGPGSTPLGLAVTPEAAYSRASFKLKGTVTGVTVNAYGVVRVTSEAVHGTEFTVEAAVGEVKAERTFTVSIPVASIAVTNALNIAPGTTSFSMTYDLRPLNADPAVSFSVESDIGVTVDGTGLVTLPQTIASGDLFTVEVRAASGVSQKATFCYGYANAVSVEITNPDTVTPGRLELTGTVTPALADQTLGYALKAEVEGIAISGNVVTVAETVSHGTQFTVVATAAGGVTGEKTFTVQVAATSVTVAPDYDAIETAGGIVKLPFTVSVLPANADRTYALTLETPVEGMRIENGKLFADPAVATEDASVVVIARAGTATARAEILYSGGTFVNFKLLTKQAVFGTQNYAVAVEEGEAYDAVVAFSSPVTVTGVSLGENAVPASGYTVNGSNVTILGSYLSTQPTGEYAVTIVTDKATVTVPLKLCDKVILTAEDLRALDRDAASRGKYYVLGADLDLAFTATDDTEWLLCAYTEGGENAFTGIFDGNGHTIKNYTLDLTSANNPGLGKFNQGLFGIIASGGVLKNLGLENANVKGQGWMGVLVGHNAGTVENCYVTGSAGATSTIGGFMSKNLLGGVVKNCFVRNKVSSDNSSADAAAFAIANEGSMTNCFAEFQKDGRTFTKYPPNEETNCGIKTTEEMQTPDTFAGYDTGIWNIVAGAYPGFLVR